MEQQPQDAGKGVHPDPLVPMMEDRRHRHQPEVLQDVGSFVPRRPGKIGPQDVPAPRRDKE